MSSGKPLRIAVDARELEGRPTGVGRVVAGLLASWPRTDDRIELICRSAIRPPWLREGWAVRTASGAPRLPGALWEQTVLPMALGDAEVLVAPNYGMPRFAPIPTAVCMHDCAPFALPETFAARERARRRWSARVAARRAAVIFMGSEFAARECHRWLGVSDQRLLVIPWGCTPEFRPASRERVATVRSRYRLRDRVVLFVGSQLQRRDIDALGRHVAQLRAGRDDLELCIVGGNPEAAEHTDQDRHVRRLGYVPDEDLPALYSAATVVAYPSRYEGFGLPVLEALACGTPVVASATSALLDVFSGRARLVDHDDDVAWLEALARLLDSQEVRDQEIARGHGWAVGRDWDASAARLRARLADIGSTP